MCTIDQASGGRRGLHIPSISYKHVALWIRPLPPVSSAGRHLRGILTQAPANMLSCKHTACLLAAATTCLFASTACAQSSAAVRLPARGLRSSDDHGHDEDAAAFVEFLGPESPLEHILELREETAPAMDIVDWLFDAIRYAPQRALCGWLRARALQRSARASPAPQICIA